MAGAALVTFAFAMSTAADAALVSYSTTHVHNNKNNFGGNMADLYTGEEITKGDANDPSTWTLTSTAYQASWQANARLDFATYGKIGYAALDFGSVTTNLDELFIWNLRDTGTTRGVKEYNIWYAGDSITSFLASPTDNSAVNYDFTAGNGWTKLNASTLTLPTASGQTPEAVISLGGIDARYIAIEIISAQGTTTRVGLNEVAVTQTIVVPEPSAIALFGIAGLGLMLRRRR